MIRGTTPIQEFCFAFDTNTIDKLSIVYVQSGRTIISKSENDVTIGDDRISFRLSQEETLLFKEGLVNIQLKIKTLSGQVIASNVITTTVYKILDEAVM